MSIEYTKEYFIAKFSEIPEEKWCTRVMTSSDGRHCAYGHCGARVVCDDTPESRAFAELFGKIENADVNDGKDPRYKQPTPKQRILAALRDLP